jgi:hypothetical protein
MGVAPREPALEELDTAEDDQQLDKARRQTRPDGDSHEPEATARKELPKQGAIAHMWALTATRSTGVSRLLPLRRGRCRRLRSIQTRFGLRTHRFSATMIVRLEVKANPTMAAMAEAKGRDVSGPK